MILHRQLPIFIYLILSAGQLLAEPLRVPLSDLLPYATESADITGLDSQVEADIRSALDEMGAEIDANGLKLNLYEQNIPLDSGCENSTKLESLEVGLTLLGDSAISLDLLSLSAQNELSLTLNYKVAAQGRIQQKLGEKLFGRCYVLAKDSFDLLVEGSGIIQFEALMDLDLKQSNGYWTASPNVTLTAEINADHYQVDVDDSFLAERSKRQIERVVNDTLDTSLLDLQVAEVENRIEKALEQRLSAYGLIDAPGLQASHAVDDFLNSNLLTVVGREYVANNYPMMARAAFSQDPKQLVNFFSQAISCELASSEREVMPSSPVYSLSSGSCKAVNSLELQQEQTLFFDNGCHESFTYHPSSWVDYCSETLDSLRLGNGLLHLEFENDWQLSPGTSLNLGVEPVEGNHMPWMTRRTYKKVEKGGDGVCELEIRIYKKSIGDKDLKPLVMLHGGAWNSRVLGFIGLEAMISHYTDAGFVVYAPFYRLTESDEATAACNGVKGNDILEDVEDALDWVSEYQAEFGSEGPIYLFGQSAGAHLALSLAYHNPDRVKKAVLMYPPTDFARLLEQYQSGLLSAQVAEGRKALESFLGRDLISASTSDLDIVANSFPEKISENPEKMPEVFIIHGVKDQVVPVDQSIRLCESYDGTFDRGSQFLPLSGLREKFSCGAKGSRLHLFAEGDHALDACVFSLFCPVGSPESQMLVADSISEARSWLTTSSAETAVKADEAVAGKIGGGGVGPVLLLLGALRLLSGLNDSARENSSKIFP